MVCLLAIVAWGQSYGWRLLPINNYVLFPLLGLLAFSIMWSHYVASSIRQWFGLPKPVLARYFRLTSLAVLVCLCLHPGLLIYQRFRDGYGLPPGSYQSYVAPGLKWVVVLGVVSLLVFLAFELHRWYAQRSWWHWVTEAGDLAMLAIVYHGFRLGGQLQEGWFHTVWWLYAVVLVLVVGRNYYLRYVLKHAPK